MVYFAFSGFRVGFWAYGFRVSGQGFLVIALWFNFLMASGFGVVVFLVFGVGRLCFEGWF